MAAEDAYWTAGRAVSPDDEAYWVAGRVHPPVKVAIGPPPVITSLGGSVVPKMMMLLVEVGN